MAADLVAQAGVRMIDLIYKIGQLQLEMMNILVNYYAKALFFALLGGVVGAVIIALTFHYIIWKGLIEKIAGRVTSRIEENMAQISSNITAELSQARDNMLALTSEIKTIRGEVRTIQGVLQNVGHQLETDFQQNMILRKKLDTARKRLHQAEERKTHEL